MNTVWGSSGSAEGCFNAPAGIATGPEGNVYVVDSNNDRIQKFAPDGTFMNAWGSVGTGDKKFNAPSGIAISENRVYVADWGNRHVKTCTLEGRFMSVWRSDGSRPGLFRRPEGVAVDSGGLYVADKSNHRIQRIPFDGGPIQIYGPSVGETGALNLPHGLAIDSQERLLVADTLNNRIQAVDFTQDSPSGTIWAADDLKEPSSLAVNSNGEVYATDWENHRVLKYTADGALIDSLERWGPAGDEKPFNRPFAASVDSEDSVYVTDTYINCRIHKFSAGGDWIWSIPADGQCGGETGQFKGFTGVASGPEDNLYVADPDNDRVQVFSPEGRFISQFGETGSGAGQFNSPEFITVGADGTIYVSDTGNNRVQAFKRIADETAGWKAVVVAGGGPYPGNSLWDATRISAYFAYRVLNYRGLSKDQIILLSPETKIDLDNNGLPDDVDGDALLDNLETAITGWASDARYLALYMADHGAKDAFRMNVRETLTPDRLRGWLDQFQPGRSKTAVVIYEACDAGSFVKPLTDGGDANRIVFAGAGSDEDAFFISQGAISFSSFFWTRIFNGDNLQEAFNGAADAIGGMIDFQHPFIASSGTTSPAGLIIGGGENMKTVAPEITAVSPDHSIEGTSRTELFAEAVDEDGVARVWAVIRPPGFKNRASDDPIIDLPVVEFSPSKVQDRYAAGFDGFTKRGTYSVFIYAADTRGDISSPSVVRVSVDNPPVHRALLILGSKGQSEYDTAVSRIGMAACKALRFQGYAAESIQVFANDEIAGPLLDTDESPPVDQPVPDLVRDALLSMDTMSVKDLVVFLAGETDDTSLILGDDAPLFMNALDEWLDTLQSRTNLPVTVICESSGSGKLLPLLTPPPETVRIIIASAASDEPAIMESSGDVSFSAFFWNGILNGRTIQESFTDARRALVFMSEPGFSGPLLDDTGDGIGAEWADGRTASARTIGEGVRLAGNNPTVEPIVPDIILSRETAATLSVKSMGVTGQPEYVFAVIRPPSESAVKDFDTIELNPAGNGVYEAVYGGFIEFGEYRVSIYARDGDGKISEAGRITVYQQDGSDSYEPDNRMADASVIVLNNPAAQHRNFSDGTADWVRFPARKGQVYAAEAAGRIEGGRVEMTVFNENGEALAADIADIGRTAMRLEWKCESGGMHYIRLKNISGRPPDDTSYRLRAFRPAGVILGFLKGAVKNAQTGDPLSGVTIETSARTSALTRPNGRYLIVQEPGVFNVTVAHEGYASLTDQIEVGEGGITIADFSLTPVDRSPAATILSPAGGLTVYAGQTVIFNGDGNGDSPLSFFWDFGGAAENVTAQNAGPVVFETPGVYTVTFSVNDGNGDTAFDRIMVTVLEPDKRPSAKIDTPAGGLTVNKGESVLFSASVSGGDPPLSCSWDFDGGAPDQEVEDPGRVTFQKPGTYNVKFTVIDKNGERARASVTVWCGLISKPPLAESLPGGMGIVSGSVYDLASGEPVSNAVIRTAAGASALSEGDGRYTIIQQAGSFDVTIDAPGYNTLHSSISIQEAELTGRNFALQSAAEQTPDTIPSAVIVSPEGDRVIPAGGVISFSGSVDGGNPPFEVSWNFDGGAADTFVKTPGDVHFDIAGSYSVMFTVSDADGDINTASLTITVTETAGRPVITYPEVENGLVSSTSELSARLDHPLSEFSHTRTQWRIASDSEFTQIAFKTESEIHLTSLPAPMLVLKPDHRYFLQVRFIGDKNRTEWSDSAGFVTSSEGPNGHTDGGISDKQNISPEMDIDRNGVPDVEQDELVCFMTDLQGKAVCLTTEDGAEIETAGTLAPDSVSNEDFPGNMPFGLIALRMRTGFIGQIAKLTCTLSEAVPSGSKWLSYSSIEGWRDISGLTGPSSDNRTFDFTVEDGGTADADGAANGIIVLTAGPKEPELKPLTVSAPDTENAGGYGCFIRAGSGE